MNSLAFDSATARHTDENGFLHVATSHISKECVNPYYGREIPGWRDRGLDPDKIYQGYRSGEELAAGAATFNGLPLQMQHHAESADNPQKETRVGSLGTDAVFNAPYLDNSLIVTDAAAVKSIEDGECRELSAAYMYDPDFTPGTFEGQKYDFVMRNIRGNHVALVEEGRAGPDVIVADQQINPKPTTEETDMMGLKELIDKMKRLIAVAEAAGTKSDPDSLGEGEELRAQNDGNDEDATEATDDEGEGGEAKEADALGAELYALIDTIQDKELAEKIKAKIEAVMMAGDEDPEKAEAGEEKAEGDDPDKKAEAVDEDPDKKPEDEDEPKVATDAALVRKVRRMAMDMATIKKQATADAQAHFRRLYDAARKVRPLVGEVDPIAFDSAGDIYRFALKQSGTPVKTKDVKALREMVDVTLVAKRKAASPVAYDAKPAKMDGAFAALSNIKVTN